MTKSYVTRCTLATLAALVLSPGLVAQEMEFTLDPLAIGLLETDVDSESAKFEEYRDLDSGFHLPLLSINGVDPAGDRYFDFRAESVGRDDARYTLGYGVWGSYGLEVDYNKIPHRFGNDAALIWNRQSRDHFALAAPVRDALQNSANQTADLQSLFDSADRVDVALQRNRTAVRLDFGRLRSLSWSLDYDNEKRSGTRPLAVSQGFSRALEILEPIDYDTNTAELRGEWSGANAGARFGYRHSTFENDIGTVFWDNPTRATDAVNNPATGFTDLSPDNEARTLFAGGRVRFGGNWYAQGNVDQSTMTQDDALLPYTLNSAITGIGFDGESFDPTDPANLPRRDADTEVEVLNLSFDVGTRFAEAFSLDFRYRYYDYDNQSARIEFPGYVRFHGGWVGNPRVTVPYAYNRSRAGVELGWDVAGDHRLGLAYFLEAWERDFRETEGTDEDIVSLTYDGRFAGRWDVRARYEIGDRTIDGTYHVAAQEESFLDPGTPNNQPGLRKLLQAAREYDELNVSVGTLFGESFDVRFGVTGRDEEYPESELGLLDSEVFSYSVDASYMPAPGTSLYLFGNIEDRETFQAARQSGAVVSTNPLDTWSLAVDETTDTWGIGLAGEPDGPLSWDLSAFWSRADGNADFFTLPGGTPADATDFADYDDVELLGFVAETSYRLSEQVSASLGYRYEDYEIRSFQFDGLENMMPAALLLVPENGDYTAHVFALSMRFRL